MPPPMSTRTKAKLRAANGVAPISADWIVAPARAWRSNDDTRSACPGPPHTFSRAPGSRPGSTSNSSGSSVPVASLRKYVNWLPPGSKLSGL